MNGNPCVVDGDCFVVPKPAGTAPKLVSDHDPGHHDKILYYPTIAYNADCWLCGR